MKGLHILADLYRCDARALLTDAQQLRRLCLQACAQAGLTILGDHFHQFPALGSTQQGGTTGTVVLGESHLAIHTWPERGNVTLDIYVCNVTGDNSVKAERLHQLLADALAPARASMQRVWRGLPGDDPA